MRKSITVQPKWSIDKEYIFQCTVRGLLSNVLTISKKVVYNKGLNSNDMKSVGFFENANQFVKYI